MHSSDSMLLIGDSYTIRPTYRRDGLGGRSFALAHW